MSLFFSYFKLAFKEKYTYKFDFYISIVASAMVLFVQVSVWKALFKNPVNTEGINLNQMIVYVMFSSIIYTLTRSDAAIKIGKKVEDGSIISDFMRPINFKNYIFAEDLGSNIFRVLFIALPAVAFNILFYNINVNLSLELSLLMLISVILGVMIAFYIKYLIALSVFWLESSWYIPFFIGAIFELFSGSTIPLWYYPGWLQTISNFLPFRFTFFEPISISVGNYTPEESIKVIITQLCWLVILYILERIIWIKAQTKIVVHGG